MFKCIISINNDGVAKGEGAKGGYDPLLIGERKKGMKKTVDWSKPLLIIIT